MILIHDPVAATNFMTVYRDSDDPRQFHYVPRFASVSMTNAGRLRFGAQLFKKNPNDPNDGFAVYNFGVTCVTPSKDFQDVVAALEASYGTGIRLSAISPDTAAPRLSPLTEGIYRSQHCQVQGANLYTDLACSFTVDESMEPDLKNFFTRTQDAWAGKIDFTVRTRKTSFDWKITANWHRVQEHFKSQASVRHWFVSANLSYETQRLIENDTIHIEMTGGTPSQKEKIHTFAGKIAQRLFVPTLQENPMPGAPSGAVICLGLNYSKIEEDRTSVWRGSESAFEDKPLGVAVCVGGIPDSYFSGYDKTPLAYDLDRPEALLHRYADPAHESRDGFGEGGR